MIPFLPLRLYFNTPISRRVCFRGLVLNWPNVGLLWLPRNLNSPKPRKKDGTKANLTKPLQHNSCLSISERFQTFKSKSVVSTENEGDGGYRKEQSVCRFRTAAENAPYAPELYIFSCVECRDYCIGWRTMVTGEGYLFRTGLLHISQVSSKEPVKSIAFCIIGFNGGKCYG